MNCPKCGKDNYDGIQRIFNFADDPNAVAKMSADEILQVLTEEGIDISGAYVRLKTKMIHASLPRSENKKFAKGDKVKWDDEHCSDDFLRCERETGNPPFLVDSVELVQTDTWKKEGGYYQLIFIIDKDKNRQSFSEFWLEKILE